MVEASMLGNRMRVNLVAGFGEEARRGLLAGLVQGLRPGAGVAVITCGGPLSRSLEGSDLVHRHVPAAPDETPRPEDVAMVLDQIVRVAPETRAFVEVPSHLVPSDILRALFGAPHPAPYQVEPTVCAVDVASFGAPGGGLGHRERTHLKGADVVVVEGLDAVEPGAENARMDVILAANPRAWLLDARAGLDPLRFLVADDRGYEADAGPPRGYSSFCYARNQGKLPRDRVERVLRRLPRDVFRIRGLVATDEGSHWLNYVCGVYELEPVSSDGSTRLTFLGRNLNCTRIVSQLTRCADEPRHSIPRSPGGANLER